MTKPTGQRWWVKDQFQLNALIEWIHKQWEIGKKPTLQMLEADRSTSQNTMFYALYADIAAQMQDRTLIEVKRDCKLRYGVVLRKGADPEWGDWYDRAIKPMSMEDKLQVMDYLPITSEFTKAQGTTYIQTILEEYGRQGFALADPRQAP